MEQTNIKFERLIVFDGICNFCNYWVNWLIKRDAKGLFKFTTLQSKLGEEIRETLDNQNKSDLDSIIFVHHQFLFTKSKAVLEIGKLLSFPFNMIARIFIFTKLFWLYDLLYDFIAKFRYNIFGKKSSCMIPDKKVLDRFII